MKYTVFIARLTNLYKTILVASYYVFSSYLNVKFTLFCLVSVWTEEVIFMWVVGDSLCVNMCVSMCRQMQHKPI